MATKQELIDEANKRGIELSGDETVADLKDKLAAADESKGVEATGQQGVENSAPQADPAVNGPVTQAPEVPSHAQEERQDVAFQTNRSAIHDEARSMDGAERRETGTVASTQAVTGDSVTVKYRDHLGQETERTFSRDVHGDRFAELADEFKKANAHRIITA